MKKPTKSQIALMRRRGQRARKVAQGLQKAIVLLETIGRYNAISVREAIGLGITSDATVHRRTGRAVRDAVKLTKRAREFALINAESSELVLSEMLVEARRR